jgi:hypothetical protein
MRTVSFALVEAGLESVEKLFYENGFERIDESKWNYPEGESAYFFITVEIINEEFMKNQSEEYEEILKSMNGMIPSVSISVDVSGRIPGDKEIRSLASMVLNRFKGYAFDDYLNYDHAWTLKEIEELTLVDGLHFFDYNGYYEQTKKRARNEEQA